jgi:hypothetical protein
MVEHPGISMSTGNCSKSRLGTGFACKDDEPPQRVRAGDTVWIAPNDPHWHRASVNTLMSHTAITIGTTEFHEAVTEAEYAAANANGRA